jgi:beta-lactam-binding protein with PASTA domain
MIQRLQQAVEEKSEVSIAVSEVNSRPMDQAKDQNVPACPHLNETPSADGRPSTTSPGSESL